MIMQPPYDVAEGLSSSQVEERIRKGLINGEQEIKTKSFKEIFLANILTPFNLLNVCLAVLILLVRSPKNALFMGVIFSNALIGTVQEIRAKKLIDKLSLIAAPKATVIRDGAVKEIPVAELVKDDLTKLRPGGQICADSVVLCSECEVNESLITGESDPVLKRTGDRLMSGSFVVSGDCLAMIEHVGADNYAAQITKQAKYFKRPSSEIMDGINRFIRIIARLIVPIGIALFLRQYCGTGNSLRDSVVSTVAALVGMIPEGLVLLTSVVLAVSVIRLARKNALVQELYSIEMLARVDVLCLDKTGTITEGSMQADRIVPAAGYTAEQMKKKIGLLMGALPDENPTAMALREFCPELTSEADIKIPFSSARKWSGVHIPGYGSLVVGASEFVLRELPEALQEESRKASAAGQRVLLLAESREAFAGQQLPPDLVPVGLILLSDRLRPSARKTLDYFARQGVTIKVISGDNPLTVSQIAKRAGLADAENYVDASTLTDEAAVKAAALRYTVFGRVTPEQKLWLVQAIKSEGHTVAMTGDGVNDVMALKESDCSIAMASGSDAARNVSQIVLLDSDFASMPSIVAEGRRSINNLQRSASLFLVKTIFSTIIGVLFIFLSQKYPLEPIQFTLISSATIGMPSFFLALEPNAERISGHFFINVIKKALPGALTNVVNVLMVIGIADHYSFTSAEISTLAVLLIGFTGLLYLFKICVPFSWSRMAIFILSCTAFTISVLFFRNWFSLVPLTWHLMRAAIPLAAISAGVLAGLMLFVEKAMKGLR